MFSKPLSLSAKPESNIAFFQSEVEDLPSFELNFNFLNRFKKPLTLSSTTKRQKPNVDKMAGTSEETKTVAKEVPASIVQYTEEEMAAFKENMMDRVQ